jgi:hypothetical protein
LYERKLIKIMGRVEAKFRSRNIRLSCSVLDASGLEEHELLRMGFRQYHYIPVDVGAANPFGVLYSGLVVSHLVSPGAWKEVGRPNVVKAHSVSTSRTVCLACLVFYLTRRQSALR